MEEFFTNLSGVLDRLSRDLTALDDCEAELEILEALLYLCYQKVIVKKTFFVSQKAVAVT
jgi:hypothetical protein